MMRSGNHHARRVTKVKRRVHFCVRAPKSVITPKQQEEWKERLLLEVEKNKEAK